MATLKLNKFRCYALLGIIIFVSCVLLMAIYTIENPYVDTNKIKKCEDNNYILNGNRTYLNFNFNVGDTDGLLLTTIDRQKRKKNIIYNKTNFSKSNLYYFDSKILKTDTLLIMLKSKIFKIYDFESKGGMVKAGENRNSYYCDFYFKINSNEQIITGDTIYISNK